MISNKIFTLLKSKTNKAYSTVISKISFYFNIIYLYKGYYEYFLDNSDSHEYHIKHP